MRQNNSDNKIYSVEVLGPESGKVIFFFCPFGSSIWQFNLPGMPIWHLTRNKYQVIAYSYDKLIATKSVEFTIKYIEDILSDASDKLETIKNEKEISCFGSSMGTLIGFNFAARHDRVRKVVLNLSYSDISDHMIAFPVTRNFPKKLKEEYIATAGSERRLRDAFDPYSPVKIINKFKNKKVLLYSSRNDKLLKLIHTVDLRNGLQDAGIETIYYENKFGGHTFCIVLNSLRSNRYMKFLSYS